MTHSVKETRPQKVEEVVKDEGGWPKFETWGGGVGNIEGGLQGMLGTLCQL